MSSRGSSWITGATSLPVAVPLAALLVVFVLGHVWLMDKVWDMVVRYPSGADYASYHYAVEVALQGGDPYDTEAISEAARVDGTRGWVHPFFYPPPFLLVMAWTATFELATAYKLWFWLDEAFAFLVAGILWRWWRPTRGGAILAFVAVITLAAIPNNHLMGQVNLPVLALALAGLWAEDRDRPWLGGALLGVACMLKMSPALFVIDLALRRRWRPVVAACATAVVLSVLTLPILGFQGQFRFYTEVLPGFGSGDYNGLRVSIGLFGNHSVPDLLHRLFPGDSGRLSMIARVISGLFGVVSIAGLWLAFRRAPADRLARAGQIGAIAVTMLLLPVYTFEHHLVWALPAEVALGIAVVTGAVPRWWAVPLLLAWAGLAADGAWWKMAWREVGPGTPGGTVLREAKFGCLLVLLGFSVALGRRGTMGR